MILHSNSPWAKLVHFADFHRRWAGILIAVFIVIGAGSVTAAYFLQPKPAATVITVKEEAKAVTENGVTKYYSPLTGLEVKDELETRKQITAIMIENSLDARPQSGIKSAGVVFEAVAEGGITRYLTLFQESRPGLIGPVRSVRPYYIDWMGPFQASIAHVGGSQNALLTLKNGGYKDIDQFFNGSYYWRATDRVAPHNVYTNFDKLDELNKKKGYVGSDIKGWPHKLDSPVAAPNAKTIHIDISSATFNVDYNYDATTNTYNRILGGKPHADREGGQIAPKVVVAMKVPTQIGFEDGYREQMDTSGYNQAYIFQDGTVQEAFWRKADARAPIYFYDKAGKPIAFNAGQAWISVTAPNKSVTWQ
ncbi:MAG TPA: DUF3048 domain-containing protein [Candidatus Saccharimonadales bacterium]|nr:DUF3048 domain-containing protein [Candidatus Saccharimonadales bacterium]